MARISEKEAANIGLTKGEPDAESLVKVLRDELAFQKKLSGMSLLTARQEGYLNGWLKGRASARRSQHLAIVVAFIAGFMVGLVTAMIFTR